MTFFFTTPPEVLLGIFKDGLRGGRPVAVAAPAFPRLDACLQQVVCSIQAWVIRVLLDIFLVVFPKV
jgi:hypothetical protein